MPKSKAQTSTLLRKGKVKLRKDLLGVGTFLIYDDRPNIKLVATTRPAGCDGETSVESSYDSIYCPLCDEHKHL